MSRRLRNTAFALAAAAATGLGPAVTAGATTTPFTLTEYVAPVQNSFTFTSDIPGCPSGTFVDEMQRHPAAPPAQQPPRTWLTLTTYICADGSTFTALKHQRLTFGADSLASSGPVEFRGGSGATADLTAHGVDNGVFDFSTATGVGTITGVITGS